jgi:hypothetical protein
MKHASLRGGGLAGADISVKNDERISLSDEIAERQLAVVVPPKQSTRACWC